jgi:hypothetical protein
MTETTIEEQAPSGAQHWTDQIRKQNQRDTLAFAKKYRLRVEWDKYDAPAKEDLHIPGSRAELYFDGGGLCLMAIDGPRVIRSKWQALGGELWMGDICAGRQDVRITNIPLESAKQAIRLAGSRRIRVLTESHKAALAASSVAHRFKSRQHGSTVPRQSEPSHDGA